MWNCDSSCDLQALLSDSGGERGAWSIGHVVNPPSPSPLPPQAFYGLLLPLPLPPPPAPAVVFLCSFCHRLSIHLRSSSPPCPEADFCSLPFTLSILFSSSCSPPPFPSSFIPYPSVSLPFIWISASIFISRREKSFVLSEARCWGFHQLWTMKVVFIPNLNINRWPLPFKEC